MKAPARLGLYGAGLVAVFAVAFATAGAVVPAGTGEGITLSTTVQVPGDYTPVAAEPGPRRPRSMASTSQ